MSAEEISAARDFRLEVFDADRLNPRDMSDSVSEIPSFTNVGSLGEVTSANVMLDAAHGWHVTRGRPGRGSGTGAAFESERGYAIDQYTLMRLTFGHGSETYSRYMEARTLKPQNTTQGILNSVDMAGLDRNLRDILVPGHWWFRTYREVIDDIISHYNAQRGTSQPPLHLEDANVRVDLDREIYGSINLYAGTDTFTAVNQIVDRLRQPLASGGLGDYISVYYTDRVNPPDGTPAWSPASPYAAGTDVTPGGRVWRAVGARAAGQEPGVHASWAERTGLHLALDMHIVSQGERVPDVPTVRAGDIAGGSTILGLRQPAASTLVVVRGTAGTGTLPMSIAHWTGRTEAFARAPPWEAGTSYHPGQLVTYRDAPAGDHHAQRRWRCLVGHTSSPANAPPAAAASSAQWQRLTEWEYVREGRPGVAVDNWAYNARESGGMWDHTKDDTAQSYNAGRSSVTYPDSNLVIRDQDVWADWVHYRHETATAGPLANDAADGTRVILDGAATMNGADGQPTGLVPGADDNAMIRRFGGSWHVVRRFPNPLPRGTVYEVNVLGEGRIYEWVPPVPTDPDTDEFWSRYDDYAPGYAVRYVAVAADVAAVPTLAAGTTYVYRRTGRLPTWYGSGGPRSPPPRSPLDWELVGALDAENAPAGHVPSGYGPERRARTGTPAWRDVSSAGLASNHCFHYPHSVRQGDPLTRLPDGGPAQFARSARVEYRFGGTLFASPVIQAEITAAVLRMAAAYAGTGVNLALRNLGLPDVTPGEDTTPQAVFKSLSPAAQAALSASTGYANLGWWYTLFEAPLPSRGGGPFRPHYLDLNNRNVTPSGNHGWAAPDAEELDKITGIRFDILFDKLVGPFRAPQGALPFRCYILDDESNVWVHDLVDRHLNVRQDVVLSLQGFKAYVARAPLNVENALLNAIRPELRNLESLNRRQVKRIGLHLLTNYDEHGRFVPWFNPWHNLLESATALAGKIVSHIGTIDNFCLVKAPIAVATRSPSENTGAPARTIMSPVTDRPISNTVQLRQAAEAQAHLQAWRTYNYTVTVAGRTDIQAEQSFYLEDPRFVSQADAGRPGTLKMVATRVSHSYQADRGAWMTDITGYLRINRGVP